MGYKTKIERLADEVDIKMRREAELLIQKGLQELTEDINELIGRAAIVNPSNPLAAIALDKRNSQILKEVIETATKARTVKGMPNATLGHLRTQSRRLRNVHARYKYHARKFDRGDLLAMTTAQNLLERYESSFRLVELLDDISAEWVKRDSDKRNIRTSIYKANKQALERQIRRRRRGSLGATGKTLEKNVMNVLRDRITAWSSGENTRKSIAGFCSSACGNMLDIKDNLFNKQEFANVVSTASRMVAEGKSPNEVNAFVRREINELGRHYGAQQAAMSTAARMVLNATYNQNVVLSVKSAIKDDTIKKTAFKSDRVSFIFRAVLDNRTSVICRFMNGRVIPADSPMLALMTPPLHANCRSMLVPNLKGLSKFGEDYGAEPLTQQERRNVISLFGKRNIPSR